MRTLPETILHGTDWLLLSGNNLGSLRKAPQQLSNIKILNLSSSKIDEIDGTVMVVFVKNAKYLDIRGNNLKTIPETIKKAKNTTKLWISDNPYQCNCDMLWMKNWLLATENVVDKKNVICSGSKMKSKINYIVFLSVLLVNLKSLKE